MSGGYLSTTLSELFGWAQASALRYFSVNTGCCADELLQTTGCRYDLERFGALPERDPVFSDLLIVSGSLTQRAAAEVRRVYEQMPTPRYVLAVGSCACSGGAFGPDATAGETVAGLATAVPVDVFVPGCPPRPEAIMDGLIRLQEKIRGRKIVSRKPQRHPDRAATMESDEWDLR